MMRYEYKGAIHLHSRYSDGSASVKEIITRAQDAALDFVMLSDHNTVAAKRDGYEGWHGNMLLLVGNEISPRTHHYLAFGIDEDLDGHDYADPHDIVDDVADRKALGIIAHPFGGKSPYLRVLPRSWHTWDIDRYDGIEIWSYMIDWTDRVTPWTLFYYYLYPERAIRGPHPEALKKWDEVSQRRRVIGIGSIDAHGKRLPIFRFIKFLPYQYLFRTIRTHILISEPLSSDVKEAQWQIYTAIRQGHCFIGYDAIGDTTGFRFHTEDGEWQMGDERVLSHPVELQIRLPQSAEIYLRHNGTVCASIRGKFLDYQAQLPGVYRIEAFLQEMPWIYSNPLFLRAES